MASLFWGSPGLTGYSEKEGFLAYEPANYLNFFMHLKSKIYLESLGKCLCSMNVGTLELEWVSALKWESLQHR